MAPAPTLAQRVGAFLSLVTIQVLLAQAFKLGQGPGGDYAFNPASVMLVAELVKLVMSLAFFAGSARAGGAAWEDVPANFREQARGRLAAGCAGLALPYCANNQFSFVLMRWADAANVNLIKGGASIVSTLLLRFWLARVFTRTQWVAVFLQVCGILVVQFGATCTNTPVLAPDAYLLLLLSLVIASLCCVLNERVLKESGASMHVVNSLMYVFGVLFNGAVFIGMGGTSATLFRGSDAWATYPVLVCNSFIGIAVSVVYLYTDATMKTLASACATAVLLIIGVAFYGIPLKVVVVVGCLTVFASTYLYVVGAAPPTGGHVQSSEGTAKALRVLSPLGAPGGQGDAPAASASLPHAVKLALLAFLLATHYAASAAFRRFPVAADGGPVPFRLRLHSSENVSGRIHAPSSVEVTREPTISTSQGPPSPSCSPAPASMSRTATASPSAAESGGGVVVVNSTTTQEGRLALGISLLFNEDPSWLQFWLNNTHRALHFDYTVAVSTTPEKLESMRAAAAASAAAGRVVFSEPFVKHAKGSTLLRGHMRNIRLLIDDTALKIYPYYSGCLKCGLDPTSGRGRCGQGG